MKRFILLLVCLIWTAPLFCSDHTDLVNQVSSLCKRIEKENNPISRSFFKTNGVLLENKIQRQVQHSEKRIAKYQQGLDDSKDSYESAWFEKKIKAQEKKLQNLNDLLDTIAIWKEKL